MENLSAPRGKTALITGAGGDVAYELAKLFAGDGHDLVLADHRSSEKLERVADDFRRRFGVTVHLIDVDLFDPLAPYALHDEVSERGISVHYLVNDAGYSAYGKFAETDLDQELKTVQLNVSALVVLTKLFLREMLARGVGRILHLASTVTGDPAPRSAICTGTEAFVLNFSEALIEELKGTGVSVTVLRPGLSENGFLRTQNGHRLAEQTALEAYRALMEGRGAGHGRIPDKRMRPPVPAGLRGGTR